jgi:3-methylcrotonyl-CoA carboxylase alpha subunit
MQVPQAGEQVVSLLAELRAAGVDAMMAFGGRSMKAQMREANKRNAEYVVIIGEQELADSTVTVGAGAGPAEADGTLPIALDLDGHRQQALLVPAQPGWTLFLPAHACHFHAVAPETGEGGGAGALAGLTAPMNGRVIALLAETGAAVTAGTPLMILEAMKMEHTIKAPVDGTIESFHFAEGDLVDGGAALLDFAPAEAAA